MKKIFLPFYILLLSIILLTGCQPNASISKEKYLITVSSNKYISEEQVTGIGEYKPGEKVTLVLEWTDLNTTFLGYFDDADNLLCEYKKYTFFMPHHDFDIQLYFYNVNDTALKIGEYMYFGMYPQLHCSDFNTDYSKKYLYDNKYQYEFFEIKDENGNWIPNDLSCLEHNWNAYNFYEEGELRTDFAFYKDFTLEEQYLLDNYRGVHFVTTYYRASDCTKSSKHPSTMEDEYISFASLNNDLKEYQTQNNKTFDAVYRYEPIKWRILQVQGNTYYLLSDKALDSQQFYHSLENRIIDGKTIYPNDWEHSDIRKWLNNDFYNTAFSENCKKLIQDTLLDNINTAKQEFQTGDDSHLIRIGSNTSTINQNNTTDKVFLPSAKDCCNPEYGFFADNDGWDPARHFIPTDYAQHMGIKVNHTNYDWVDEWGINPDAYCFGTASYVWTRSGIETGSSLMDLMGKYENHQSVMCMDTLGDLEQSLPVSKTFAGVAPAIVITLQ